MSFKQKIFPDKAKLLIEIEKLLSCKIEEIELEYQTEGSTGGVYKISIYSEDSNKDMLLKSIENLEYLNFYNDILKKEDLNHPQIFGEIVIDTDKFLLMEWVNTSRLAWAKDDYFLALKWLVNKDKIFTSSINNLQKYEYIFQRQNYLQDLMNERVKVLTQSEMKYPKIFPIKVKKLLDLSNSLLDSLSSEPLTLVHSDFCKNNILINHLNQLYVIDWTGPFVGSVGLDLAKILNDSPSEFREEMINLYVELTGFKEITKTIERVRLNELISHINWRMKRLLRGDDKLEEINEEIWEVMNEITGFVK
jgi:thiamine kinase-like enzyme